MSTYIIDTKTREEIEILEQMYMPMIGQEFSWKDQSYTVENVVYRVIEASGKANLNQYVFLCLNPKPKKK